ncbi:MAG: SNF2-related protein [Deferrisomatales bacterium]|nr:SNF2-related protein [Deferrisomatales bacterium]
MSAASWTARIQGILDRGVSPEPLAVAEEALREEPTDPELIHLAALAALVAGKPDRCLRYLKRLEKRYQPLPCDHLLRALVLVRQGLPEQARKVLERHGLADARSALREFRGGEALYPWMLSQWHQAFYRPAPRPAKKPAAGPAPRGGRKPPGKAPAPTTPPHRGLPARAASAPAAHPGVPELPVAATRIPVRFDWANRDQIRFRGNGPEPDAHRRFRLRGDLARLALLQGFDELLCLSQLRGVETYWYQVETVRKVLKQFRGRVLLADEVGLGKTIEAGMALKEYAMRGMAERFLVLTPASLVGQWQEELETKFGLSCRTSYDPLLRADPEVFWSSPRIVASIAAARRKEHFERVAGREWDVVVVDEAHHLKNRTTQNYKLVDALKKRFLLLLSATPVQNSLVELYNLLTLLKPGIFRTEKEFREAHMTPGKPRVPLHRDRMRDLMRDVMVRNTRGLVDVRLPPRHATTLRVPAGAEERACYDALTSLVRDTHLASSGGHRLALHHLLTAAGSSPAAAAGALERFARRHGDSGRWDELATRYRPLGVGAKGAALLELLRRNPGEKKIVFVHHRETLDHLRRFLEGAGVACSIFEGGMSGLAKDSAVADFRDRIPVLLSTESGGEGRNLQFANTLVNFDLPWNPMAIEQRIGRLHRIGQHREVFVFNLALPGTIEDEILRILDEKINMFELVVGEVGAILGEIEEGQDFSELVFDAWLRATGGEGLGNSGGLAELGDRLVRAREQYEAVKELDEKLFGDDLEAG